MTARGVNELNVVVLPGDGVGPEVTAAAERVLAVAARQAGLCLRLERHLIGGAALERGLPPLPEETLQAALKSDAVLLGAVGGPQWDDNPPELRPEAGLLRLRKALGVFANLRPVRLYPSLADVTPLRSEGRQGSVDLLIVRELIGGLYFGSPKRYEGDQAVDTMAYQVFEVERLARVAFEAARRRRRHLVSVDKSNVLMCSRLWRDVFSRVAREYPDVTLEHMLVDTAAMQLVARPERFDVLATENTFGDILSDEAAALVGSIGLLPSASLGESGRPGLYEPVHGSAPDIAGQGRANPIGAVLSVAMLFRYQLNRADVAQRIESAVEAVLAEGVRTADLAVASAASTDQVAEAIVRHLG